MTTTERLGAWGKKPWGASHLLRKRQGMTWQGPPDNRGQLRLNDILSEIQDVNPSARVNGPLIGPHDFFSENPGRQSMRQEQFTIGRYTCILAKATGLRWVLSQLRRQWKESSRTCCVLRSCWCHTLCHTCLGLDCTILVSPLHVLCTCPLVQPLLSSMSCKERHCYCSEHSDQQAHPLASPKSSDISTFRGLSPFKEPFS